MIRQACVKGKAIPMTSDDIVCHRRSSIRLGISNTCYRRRPMLHVSTVLSTTAQKLVQLQLNIVHRSGRNRNIYKLIHLYDINRNGRNCPDSGNPIEGTFGPLSVAEPPWEMNDTPRSSEVLLLSPGKLLLDLLEQNHAQSHKIRKQSTGWTSALIFGAVSMRLRWSL